MLTNLTFISKPTITFACINALCAETFLQPGPHTRSVINCMNIISKAKSARLNITHNYTFGTWMPKEREVVLLVKHEDTTLVYIISQNTFYKGNTSVLLSNDCPHGTVFIAQFTMDNVASSERLQSHTPTAKSSSTKTGRLLVFDILSLNHKNLNNMDPRERYALLQQLTHVFSLPLCVVQWVGDCVNLTLEIKNKKFQIPHEVQYVVKLTHNIDHLIVHEEITMNQV